MGLAAFGGLKRRAVELKARKQIPLDYPVPPARRFATTGERFRFAGPGPSFRKLTSFANES
jgi:hypothetical protein